MRFARVICAALLSFGALGAQPLDTLFVLEASPGTERATDLIRPDVLDEEDRAGVIAFFKSAYVLQPLTENRDDIAAALQQAGLRVGTAVGGPDRRQMESNFTIDIAEALRKTCAEFGRSGATERRRAIVLIFAGEDPNLGIHIHGLETMLGTAGARLYAVVVPRIAAPDVPATTTSGASPFPPPSPMMTAQLVSRLAKESGGRIFRRNWDLKEILKQARKP